MTAAVTVPRPGDADDADAVLKVELYNLFAPGRRFPRNGWLVARYVPCDRTPGGYRRCETVRDFGTDEHGARAFVARSVEAHRGSR